MKIITRAFVLAAAASCAVSAQESISARAADADVRHERPLQFQAGQAPQGGGRGQTPPVQRRREIPAEERAQIEAAIPARAPAVPQKPRKLLVFDINGYGGHASIPHANLALQLMGERTGAFQATVSSDPATLEAANLRQFDAVYLNNTVGDAFSTPALREAFAAYIANGGGLIGHHATTVASPQWTEFGEILGARGASHQDSNEKVVLNVEDPSHPITRVFEGRPFEFADEIFRLQAPYSRDTVRVLLSIDPIATNMTQGRCRGQCFRDDNDYAIAWIRQHGNGRVFYTTLGHNPYVFWDPRMLEMFLAGIQYALGDLQVDATPRPRGTARFDDLLASVAQYDWGKDPAAVRRLELELPLVTATPAGAAAAEEKLLRVLQSNVSLAAKDAICRQLAVYGSARSVPVLEALARTPDTQAMARYALHGIQGQALPGAR